MLAFVLVALLGHPDFETREWASATLTRLVDGRPWVYGERVKRLSQQSASPEIRSRGRVIASTYDRWRVYSYTPSTVPVFPCCDMMPLPTAWGDVRCRALGMQWWEFGGVFGHEECPYYHRYRRGTERMVRQLLVDGATYAEVDALLARMWAVEVIAQTHWGAAGQREIQTWQKWEGGYPHPK